MRLFDYAVTWHPASEFRRGQGAYTPSFDLKWAHPLVRSHGNVIKEMGWLEDGEDPDLPPAPPDSNSSGMAETVATAKDPRPASSKFGFSVEQDKIWRENEWDQGKNLLL